MVVVREGTPERHGRDGVWCDPCLEPLVRALNDGGIPTVASCCGHGRGDGSVVLADGRELVIREFVPHGEAMLDRSSNATSGVESLPPM